MARLIEANHVVTFPLRPTAPFHFDGTVHKPSHFPGPDSDYESETYWQTLRLADSLVGLRLSSVGTSIEPELQVAIYSSKPLPGTLYEWIVQELRWRFDLDADIAEFCRRFRDDPVLGSAIDRWEGMRISTPYSLYEFLIVTIVLQNATVGRTAQMFQALFARYGTRMRFDGKELYGFWPPQALQAATEEELRALKVGYRAKSLKRVTHAFVDEQIDALALRAMDRETARPELLKLYGIGPASVWYILFEVFHHYDAFDVISPWEQKIYSRLLFDTELPPAERILAEVKRRWGQWRMLASHYIFEDLFWRRKTEPVPWLEALIRL